MSPSPRLVPAHPRRAARRLVATGLVLAGGFVLAGCGAAPEAARVEALPVPASSTDTPCPITGADMADALRTPRVVLLRSEGGICAYGVPAATGRAALTSPIARIVGDEATSIEVLREQAQAADPLLVSDRADLGPGAFSRTQALLRGRARATITFPRGAGVWSVIVDMPTSDYARTDALDRAESLADLLLTNP